MQNHEQSYEIYEQASVSEHSSNTDPREQGQEQISEGWPPYSQGYGHSERNDIWSEGEKLRVEPARKNKQSVSWFLGLIILLCALFIAGSILGLILIWLSWLVLTVLVTIGIFAFILNWRIVSIPMPERRFQISEHARLVINNGLGRVAIRRGEPDAITVNVTKRASGFGINPEKMQVLYNQRASTLGISTKVRWNIFQFGLRCIDFEITVPENCNVQIDNASGNVLLQGTSGDIRLRTGSGRIEAHKLQGQILLKTGSGRITGSDLQGQIDIVTGSGSIESSGLRGQVALTTGSGRIIMQNGHLAGSSRVSTGSGRIAFDGTLDPQGDTLLKTGSGSITLRLPDDAAFSLDARTGSGGVVNEFGGNPVGSEPRTQLTLRTGSGRIRISRSNLY
ncbi:MAG TPA: DUF4097 family beta strand repeat-containing protein [Ktedonobacteraceae bacterium]